MSFEQLCELDRVYEPFASEVNVKVDIDNGKITLNGLSRHVTEVKGRIGSLLNKLHTQTYASTALQYLEVNPIWSYEDIEDFRYVNYNQNTSILLEKAYRNKETRCVFANALGQMCIADFSTMTEYLKNDPEDKTKITRMHTVPVDDNYGNVISTILSILIQFSLSISIA